MEDRLSESGEYQERANKLFYIREEETIAKGKGMGTIQSHKLNQSLYSQPRSRIECPKFGHTLSSDIP